MSPILPRTTLTLAESHKVILDLVESPERRVAEHVLLVEKILERFRSILESGDRVAYSCWPHTTNSFELAALLWLIDTYVCGNCETAAWNEEPPMTAALRAMGFSYSVNFAQLGPMVAGSTTWHGKNMTVEINSTLHPFLTNPLDAIDGFYSYDPVPTECGGCKQKHSTKNVLSEAACPFEDVRLRSNHVGKVNCRRAGCLLETLLHEYCHVVEFAYRCITHDRHSWGKHNENDDKNKLFLRIRGSLAPAHRTSFNNLLHSTLR